MNEADENNFVLICLHPLWFDINLLSKTKDWKQKIQSAKNIFDLNFFSAFLFQYAKGELL